MRTQQKNFLIVLSITILCACITTVHAFSNSLNYQAYLTDNTGSPLNGAYNINFSLYTTATGGSLLWNESHIGVNVDNGLLSVELGALVSLPGTLFETPLYLGVSVASDSEMTPRKLITSFPTASRAIITEGVQVNGITSVMIRNGAISPAKLMSTCNDGEMLIKSASGWACGTLP